MDDERAIPRLMLVIDGPETAGTSAAVVAAAVAGGVDALRLGGAELAPAERRALAERLRDAVAGRAPLLVDGDPALAAALGAGLHLPEAGIAAAEARRRLGREALLGRSVSSPAAAGASGGVDYVLAEGVFEAAAGGWPLGPGGLVRIVEATWAATLAGGGVTAERVPAALAAGAHGVAVDRAILATADPGRAAEALRAAIDAATSGVGTAPPPTDSGRGPNASAPPAAAAIPILVDGEPVEVEAETTVTDLLTDLGLWGHPPRVVRNGVPLARYRYDDTTLAPGDRLELGDRGG